MLLNVTRNIIKPCHRRSYSSTTSDPFKVLFFGRDEFSCEVLLQLVKTQARDVWQNIQVVTQPDTWTGRRGSKLSESPLKVLSDCLQLKVHTIPPRRPDFKTWQLPDEFALKPKPSLQLPPTNHLLVTASFGRILPNSLLDSFLPTRRLNVHPSLLPMYRGAAPIQHALVDGRKETGVCVIEMTERGKGIDSGAIWASEKMDIPDTAKFSSLRDSLAKTGGQLLVSVMRNMLSGKDTRSPQAVDPTAPHAPLITARDAIIDFRHMTASRIVVLYRAIAHQKPLTTALKTARTLQLHEPTVVESSNVDVELPIEGAAMYHPPTKSLIVRCAENTYLSLPSVRQQDRGLLNAKEWWNGVNPKMRLYKGIEGPVHFVPFEIG